MLMILLTYHRYTAILTKSGVKVEEVSFPTEIGDGEAMRRTEKVIISGEAQVTILREYRLDKTKLDPEIFRLVENISNFAHKERMQALDRYARVRPIVDQIPATFSRHCAYCL